MNVKTRREVLEESFEESPEDEAVESAEVEVKSEVSTEPVAKEQVAAQKIETEEQEDKGAPRKPEKATTEAAAPTPPTEEESQPPAPEVKAPISWKAEEKEHWAKIPPQAQQAIARRELEIQQTLSRTAQSRKFVDEFQHVVAPYAHLIRAQNSTPLQAVNNLMSTAAGLTVGDQRQKAQIVAEIINNYGVDITTLDAVLSSAQGQPPSPGHGTAAIPPQMAQALQPVYNFMETIEQRRAAYEQEMQERANQDIASFGATRPFFDELREDMADLMEVGAKRGITVTLEDAYNRALALHPQYQQAAQQKQKSSSVSEAAATLARARRTASSVKGSPSSGSVGEKVPTTRREALEQAWSDKAR